MGREIQEGIGDTKVQLQADTAKAKSEIDEAARDRRMTVHAEVDKSQLSQIGSTVSATLVDAASKASAAMRPAVQSIEAELSKASAALAKLENQQADAAGKARVAQERVNEAEEKYNALKDKGTAKASQMAAAEEALAKARRDSAAAGQLEADLSRNVESRKESIATLKVEADTAQAEEQIDKVTEARESTVEVKADTAKAEVDIAKAARDRSAQIKLDVDKSQLDQLSSLMQSGRLDSAKSLSSLIRARQEFRAISENPLQGVNRFDYSNALLGLKSAEKSFAQSMQSDVQNAMQSGVSSGGTAGVSALSPVLLGVGITMAAGIASALSGLAGLIPAAVGGAGLGIGTLVVGLDGVKDAWDAVGKASKDSGTDQEAKAKAVATATRSLRDAVKDEARAQTDVANARKDARQQLEDLNLELRGGVLDETEAVLQAQKAREDLATGMYETSTDYELAQLRVLQADQRVAESHDRNIEMQEKATDARAKGVDGADNVVAANDRLAQTQDRVAEAQQNVNDAVSKTSTAAQDAAEKMALLSPAGQQLITTLQSMMPQFQAFKFAIQDALLTGIGPQIQQLASTYLPMLQSVMGSMASTMNQAFGSLTQLFQTPEMLASMQTIFDNIGSSFGTWAQSLVPLAQAFTKLTEVGSTFLPQLADGAVQAAQSFAQFIDEAANSGQLQQWIQTGITTMTQLGGIIEQLGPIFLAMAPIGTAVLSAIQTILGAVAPAIGPLSTAFAALITAITPILGVVQQLASTIITAVAPSLTMWLNTMAPVIQQMAGLLQPVLESLQPVLAQVAQVLAGAMVEGIKTILPVLGPFVQATGQLLAAVLPLLPSLVQLAISALPAVQQAIATILPIMTEWMGHLTDIANVIVPPLVTIIDALATTFGTSFDRIKSVVTTVWDVVGPILDGLASKLDMIEGPLTKIAQLFLGDAPGGATVPKTPGAAVTPGVPGLPAPGAPGSPFPAPAGTAGDAQRARRGERGAGPGMPAPAAPPGADWDKIAQGESGGNWQANTGNGFYGGLQFTQSTWDQFKPPGAPATADKATKEQQIAAAENTLKAQGPGAWPKTFAPAPAAATNPFAPASAPAAGSAGVPAVSAYMPPAAMPGVGANPADAALLANVPAGKYGRDLGDDLTKGLGDCSSAIEDLVNLMDGRPTAGASMATGNEADWLTKRGFLPGMGGPGDFRVGFNSHHTQATLPGGTPFNWGSDSAAARGGVGGTGADDKAFTSHYYRPAKGGPGMPGVPTGQPTDPMYIALSPNIPAGQQKGSKDKDSGGEQLGQDILGGMGEIFGLDGSVFKDPTQFGLFKIMKGLMGLKFADGSQGGVQGGDGASLFGGGGGGGGGLGGILSAIPQAFGNLKVGSPQDAPGQFMPSNPGSTGTGGIVLNPFAPPGAAGPGNQQGASVVNNFHNEGSNYGYSQTAVQDAQTQTQMPAVRVGTLHGPASG